MRVNGWSLITVGKRITFEGNHTAVRYCVRLLHLGLPTASTFAKLVLVPRFITAFFAKMQHITAKEVIYNARRLSVCLLATLRNNY